VSAVDLIPQPSGPGYWWVAADRDPGLGQRLSGHVFAAGSLWVASGPQVRLVEAALATPYATPREAAEAAWLREGLVRPALAPLVYGLPGRSLRVIDGNAYTAAPERWNGEWADALDRGRRVMLGAEATEAAYLARYETGAAPWQSAAVAFCRAFPRLWLVVGEGPEGCHVRLRGEYVEYLHHVGVREYTYLSRDGATVVLVEID
jgi:hypothetical protein